jgi:hypothetical protein
MSKLSKAQAMAVKNLSDIEAALAPVSTTGRLLFSAGTETCESSFS